MSDLPQLKIDVDYNEIRAQIIRAIQGFCGGMLIAQGCSKAEIQNRVIVAEAEVPNEPRPKLPYFTMKITTPASRYGDDTKQNVSEMVDGVLTPTTRWSSGGPRKMTVSFNTYAKSHEDAYNLMLLWQTALDTENAQAFLREKRIAVWIIGTIVDLSQLLNTGYEGRAQMDCQFGLAVNTETDLGAIESVTVQGAITTDQNTVEQTSTNISKENEES